jgi:DNA-binding transcriptional regulator GbsR (MarR family)
MPSSPPLFEEGIQRDPVFERECVALFSEFLHVLGVPKSIGSIYGLLYAVPEALCFADIAERLEMSKGSVSQGLAFLHQIKAVKVLEIAGDRREFFEPELGLRRFASGLIKEKIQPLVKETKETVARLKRQVECVRDAKSGFHLERIRQLEVWHRQLGHLIPLVQTALRVTGKLARVTPPSRLSL